MILEMLKQIVNYPEILDFMTNISLIFIAVLILIWIEILRGGLPNIKSGGEEENTFALIDKEIIKNETRLFVWSLFFSSIFLLFGVLFFKILNLI